MTTDYRVELFQEETMQTVGIVFDRPADPHNLKSSDGKVYTYKAPIDLMLAVGDQVVVQVSQETKVVTVVEVHDIPNIDYTNSSIHYKWIVCKVDFSEYNKLLEQERIIRQNLRQLARKNQRTYLVNQLKDQFGESVIEGITSPRLNVPNFNKRKPDLDTSSPTDIG